MALAFEEDGQSKAIAAEWEIDPDLLDEAEWELESIDNNDGFTVGYFVRFSEDTDRELLDQLGVPPGEFYRELSMNAFHEPDDEEEYERYRAQYGDDRRRIADRNPAEWGNIMSDFARGDGDSAATSTGAAFAGASFAGNSFAVGQRQREDDFEETEPSPRRRTTRRGYYLDEERFTPSQFRRISRRRKVEAMVQWFHDNYEDPAVRTPYESAEGGYQWIWGGPYDAHEQIGDQFSDVADEEAIEAAVSEVTKDGLFDWAPKERREDYASDEDFNEPGNDEDYSTTSLTRRDPSPQGEINPFSIGGANFLTTDQGDYLTDDNGNPLVIDDGITPVESLRREMLARMDNLEAVFRQSFSVAPNRGHNHPPELLDIEPPVTQAQIQELAEAVAEIRSEANTPQPNPEVVVEKASILRRFGAWLADASGNGVVGAVVGAGVGLMWEHRQALFAAVMSAADAALAWAHQLPLPF